MSKYKEKYKPGMIFRSKKYPYADILIDFVSYNRMAERVHEFNMYSIIDWTRANKEAFDKFISEIKGEKWDGKNTFPYPYWGEKRPTSMDAYIQRYKLDFVGMSDREVTVYRDDECEYSAGLKEVKISNED